MSGNLRRPRKVKSKAGIMLDLGAGTMQRPGFVRMDKRKDVHPDILHDMEKFPYPLEDQCVIAMVASNILEHLKPWIMIDLMNELWRIAKPECHLAISVPYGYSDLFLQDPTHCNAMNETTWQYFDPRFQLYLVYEPKPWKIFYGPVWQGSGMMEVILEKILPTTLKP